MRDSDDALDNRLRRRPCRELADLSASAPAAADRPPAAARRRVRPLLDDRPAAPAVELRARPGDRLGGGAREAARRARGAALRLPLGERPHPPLRARRHGGERPPRGGPAPALLPLRRARSRRRQGTAARAVAARRGHRHRRLSLLLPAANGRGCREASRVPAGSGRWQRPPSPVCNGRGLADGLRLSQDSAKETARLPGLDAGGCAARHAGGPGAGKAAGKGGCDAMGSCLRRAAVGHFVGAGRTADRALGRAGCPARRERSRRGATLNLPLPEAFALCRESQPARRRWRERALAVSSLRTHLGAPDPARSRARRRAGRRRTSRRARPARARDGGGCRRRRRAFSTSW